MEPTIGHGTTLFPTPPPRLPLHAHCASEKGRCAFTYRAARGKTPPRTCRQRDFVLPSGSHLPSCPIATFPTSLLAFIAAVPPSRHAYQQTHCTHSTQHTRTKASLCLSPSPKFYRDCLPRDHAPPPTPTPTYTAPPPFPTPPAWATVTAGAFAFCWRCGQHLARRGMVTCAGLPWFFCSALARSITRLFSTACALPRTLHLSRDRAPLPGRRMGGRLR